MMKKYVQGLITGILIGAIAASVPAIAENVDVLFNTVRININGIDRIQWDEDIKLNEGRSAPSSILYNDTTYLPMRKISELMGSKVYWNGDSKTVSVTGKQVNVKTVAEKADKNGNVWRYYTFEDVNGNKYLGVADEVRGYERIYKTIDDILVMDDEIYFFKDDGGGAYSSSLYPTELTKLTFENDENSQDGERIKNISYLSSAEFENGYIYYAYYSPGNAPKGYYGVYNCITSEFAESNWSPYGEYTNLQIEESSDARTVISYNYINTMHNISAGKGKFIFDKTTNSFVSTDNGEK